MNDRVEQGGRVPQKPTVEQKLWGRNVSAPLVGQKVVGRRYYGRVVLFRSYRVVRWSQLLESPEYQDGKLKCSVGS